MQKTVRRGGKKNRKHGNNKKKACQQRYVLYGRREKNATKRAVRHAKRVALFREKKAAKLAAFLEERVARRKANAMSRDPQGNAVRPGTAVYCSEDGGDRRDCLPDPTVVR